MIHTRTKIIALISGLFFVGSVTIYGIFFGVLSGHKAQLAEERQWVAQAESEKQAFSTLQETLASSESDREKLKKYVIKDDEIIELLSLIERTAKDEGVTLTTDSLTVEPQDETFETLVVALKLQGSFNNVMQVIQILEVLPERSNITSVELEAFDEEGVALWQGAITLRVTKFTKS